MKYESPGKLKALAIETKKQPAAEAAISVYMSAKMAVVRKFYSHNAIGLLFA
jgi:cbb3-type cytochrome oxidase subunit 1